MRPVFIVTLLSLAPYAIARDFHLFTRNKHSGSLTGPCSTEAPCAILCDHTEDWRIGAVAAEDYHYCDQYMNDNNFPQETIDTKELTNWNVANYPRLCGANSVNMQVGSNNKLQISDNSDSKLLLAECYKQTNIPNNFECSLQGECADWGMLRDEWYCFDQTKEKECLKVT